MTFSSTGRQGLKAPRADRGDATDRRLKQAERKVGELTLENEIRGPRPKMGAPDPAEEAATIAMELSAPLSTVCTVLGAPRSTIYGRRSGQRGDNVIPLRRPGPVGAIDDEQLLALIRQVLDDSPFTGEGRCMSSLVRHGP
jgi:hypothetical protein